MKHFRVIKENNKYYVQQRKRFIFWTYWVYLDAYGNDHGWSGLNKMEFENEWCALDAMNRCADNPEEIKNGFEIVKTLDC